MGTATTINKVMRVEEAINSIKDGDTIAVTGFVGCNNPEDLTIALEQKFLSTGAPKDLTLVYAAGQGDSKDRGLNRLGHEKLLKRVIGGHWGLVPKLQKLAIENKVEAYNLPQGVIIHMYRDIAAGKPGTLTHVGLNTFVDPRLEGGKLNRMTTDDIIRVMRINGKDYLFYQSFPIHVAFIRATYCDEDGNASYAKEAVTLECLSLAQAVKASGGKVFLQVEKVVERGALKAKDVKIPGIYIDGIIIGGSENSNQIYQTPYNPAYSGEVRVPTKSVEPMKLDQRKIISRRAAMELQPFSTVNLGIGIPEGVANVANEEGISGLKLTVESGPVGGVPAGGSDFGASLNPDCILDSPYQFDFYDGGGLDITFLGLAQCDKAGNINVSRFGPKIAGCGGFINISQNAKKVIFCGTFTTGGLKLSVDQGKLVIDQEGITDKFVNRVEQVTFSGSYAAEIGQNVLYITERAVFKLTNKGLVLTEIAPGIDLVKDVLSHMAFRPVVAQDLKVMDARIFREATMGLSDN